MMMMMIYHHPYSTIAITFSLRWVISFLLLWCDCVVDLDSNDSDVVMKNDHSNLNIVQLFYGYYDASNVDSLSICNDFKFYLISKQRAQSNHRTVFYMYYWTIDVFNFLQQLELVEVIKPTFAKEAFRNYAISWSDRIVLHLHNCSTASDTPVLMRTRRGHNNDRLCIIPMVAYILFQDTHYADSTTLTERSLPASFLSIARRTCYRGG
jgi:hypothetical protein